MARRKRTHELEEYEWQDPQLDDLRADREIQSMANRLKAVSDPRYLDQLPSPRKMWTTVRNAPGMRTWRVVNDAVFCLTSFPIGVMFFIVAVVGGSVGLSLSWLGIGVIILAWTFALLLWGAQLERARLNAFLSVDVGETHHWSQSTGNVIGRTWQVLRNPQVWRDFLYMALLFPLGLLELALVLWPVQFFTAPLVYFAFGSGLGTQVWGIDINHPGTALFLLVLGVIFSVVAGFIVNITAKLHGQLGLMLLGSSHEEVLTERVEELTESRSAVMRAMHMERLRIERDLHDGAQQQLVALAMDLGRAREKMESDPDAALALIDKSHEQAKRVMTDMRELVRGIHPAVLTDRGLDAAVSAVAGRSPIPVDVAVHLRDRLSEEVEGTAYFVVVEALANVAKHSRAERARVSITRDGNWLRITVTDNGRGGADPTQGSGMQGLQDRILALEGTFAYTSPPGKGTRITVEIPCEPSLPKIPSSSAKV